MTSGGSSWITWIRSFCCRRGITKSHGCPCVWSFCLQRSPLPMRGWHIGRVGEDSNDSAKTHAQNTDLRYRQRWLTTQYYFGVLRDERGLQNCFALFMLVRGATLFSVSLWRLISQCAKTSTGFFYNVQVGALTCASLNRPTLSASIISLPLVTYTYSRTLRQVSLTPAIAAV